ncbi:methionine aminopeptidase, partial [Amylocystis lapponica]
ITRSVTKVSTVPESSDSDYDFGLYDVILPKEPFVWGVSHIKPRPVPGHIHRPHYALASGPSNEQERRKVHPPEGRTIARGEDEARLRSAAKLAREVLQYAGSLVNVGVTTDWIDAQVHEMVLSNSAYPSPLLYNGYPKSCCTSVNNIVTHGIPDNRPLQDGDIVNIDITIYKDGFHGDTSQMFLVGDVAGNCAGYAGCLGAGIAACAPGRPFKGIGKAIFDFIRHKDFSVSTQFTGHGIGEDFHRVLNDEPGVMLPGHCFTIENCARSAQAEHMVLITDTAAEVLT